jgi:hypothetical protein
MQAKLAIIEEKLKKEKHRLFKKDRDNSTFSGSAFVTF